MRHPFDGINQPEAPATRRSWIKMVLGALAGVLGLSATSRAAAPPRKVRLEAEPSPEPPADTTRALREQGGLTKARGEGAVTQAVNEQGGPTTKRVGEEGAMTKALNENGGPRVTTLAIGEEGGRKPIALPPIPNPPPGGKLTAALRERGS